MIKKSIAIILLGSCFASTSFSFNLFPKIEAMEKKHVHNALNTQANDFTNFSGTWSGICTGMDDDGQTTLVIESDGNYISLGGQEYIIGASNNTSTNDKWSSTTTQDVVNWNQDRTQLLLNSTVTIYNYADYPYTEDNLISTLLSKGTISLRNEQLHINLESIYFKGLQQKGGKYTIACTLNKA